MKIFRKYIFVLFIICLGITPCYAKDSNGVEVTSFSKSLVYGLHIDHFTAFNPTSATYIYNEAGESAVVSGEVICTGIDGLKSVTISIPTLGSTSIDVRIEGRLQGSATWSNIFTKNFSAATTIDFIMPFSEYINGYRVGVKVNTNGTDVINIRSTFETHR